MDHIAINSQIKVHVSTLKTIQQLNIAKKAWL